MHAGSASHEQDEELLEMPKDKLRRALDLDSTDNLLPKDLKVHLFIVVDRQPTIVGWGVSLAKSVSAQHSSQLQTHTTFVSLLCYLNVL